MIFCFFLYFLDPWDRFNLVQIKLSLNLPQKLFQTVEYRVRNQSYILENLNFNTRIVNSNISSYGLILGVQILAYILLLYCTICSHSIHGATIVSWQMQVLIEEMHF